MQLSFKMLHGWMKDLHYQPLPERDDVYRAEIVFYLAGFVVGEDEPFATFEDVGEFFLFVQSSKSILKI